MTLTVDQFYTDLKRDMTPDTVDIRATSTVNNYGERTFTGGATTYDAYIVRAEDVTRDLDENIMVTWAVYIPDASLTLNVVDQITLPAPISATRPIVQVKTKKDEHKQQAVVAFV